MRMKFDVVPVGKTTATVILTQEQVDALRGEPGRGRVMLAVTYKGSTFRTSVSVYRGEWMTIVNQEMQAGGLAPGKVYTVDVVRDTEERTVEVPADLKAALTKAKVLKAFEGYSYSHRKEWVRSVEDAKKPETRERRIAKVVEDLSA
jgi:hypothetical protein